MQWFAHFGSYKYLGMFDLRCKLGLISSRPTYCCTPVGFSSKLLARSA